MKNSGKTRITVLGRSEGDGMENIPSSELDDVKNWRDVHVPPGCYFVPSHGKSKEPKFVPYEPYKAAVSPIFSKSQGQKAVAQCIADSERIASLADSIIQQYEEVEPRHCLCSPDCKKKTSALEERISALEKENKELTSQYHVQTEVNSDLKKMLVASLGEDVQLKVQFMTEDKALLGKELLRLNEDLDEVREEADQLTIQSDVWESKFKASSLMVKELAQWKASLSCRLRESFRGIDALLEEHNCLFEQLCATHRILENTLSAFDIRAKDTIPQSVQSVNVLGLAMDVNHLSSSIQERLLGRLYCNNLSDSAGFKYIRQSTRAENLVHQILKSFEQNGALQNSELSNSMDPHPADHICTKSASVSFCKHCSGEIKVL